MLSWSKSFLSDQIITEAVYCTDKADPHNQNEFYTGSLLVFMPHQRCSA